MHPESMILVLRLVLVAQELVARMAAITMVMAPRAGRAKYAMARADV